MPSISTSPSSVSFPASESSPYPISNLYHNVNRSTHLPFRRMSIPSAPSLLHRQSVVSMESFDSLPEQRTSPGPVMPAVMKNAIRKSKGRPPSLDAIGKRYSRRKEVRPVDEAREAKRLKIIHEFHDTEKAYVEGLDLIYSHFLTPIIASLDTIHPLLSRAELTSVFSNFIDIWNLHRSFFSSLSSLLNASTSATPLNSPSPPLSPILLSHFPYLSLYSPFVTSFPATISSLTSLLLANSEFASFITRQEADSRCGNLKLRDWLLTIVQRCPRYLLLLKDLIGCTESDDSEHAQLMTVHTLVSKITLSLNTSLHTHSQTLSLLALQRSTSNLPFQLITPGRTFLKRGSLLQLERSSAPKEREFLLFSDRLIWLANAEKGDGGLEDWDLHGGAPKGRRKSLGVFGAAARPSVGRSRSRSEAELLSILNKSKGKESDPGIQSESGTPSTSDVKPSLPLTPTKKKTRQASSSTEEKWAYKDKIELVDLEVVVSRPMEDGEERRFEVLSPSISFAVYALSEQERDEWTSAIRHAKASLLVSLNATHPNSTLTSSSSTNHLRQSLQALPHSPEEEHRKPKRSKVEHFVPAIWIPDAKTEGCMRCGRTFGWRRRRHHCRLCGRCVCASCSGRTFFISDSRSKTSTKSARACDACYDTVFPLIDLSSPHSADTSISPSNSTLTGFPSWLSMPSFALPTQGSTPDALMAIESPKRSLHRIDDHDNNSEDIFRDADGQRGTPTPRIRMKSSVTRPRSYHLILEDFQGLEQGRRDSHATVRTGYSVNEREETENEAAVETESTTSSLGPVDSQPSTSWRKEDTARRRKRFSLPAIALQTTSVTARPNATGDGRSKRFSLVLGGRSSGRQGQSEVQCDEEQTLGKGDLGSGVAAVKLGELLGRRKE